MFGHSKDFVILKSIFNFGSKLRAHCCSVGSVQKYTKTKANPFKDSPCQTMFNTLDYDKKNYSLILISLNISSEIIFFSLSVSSS